jgi:hypothetical protein
MSKEATSIYVKTPPAILRDFGVTSSRFHFHFHFRFHFHTNDEFGIAVTQISSQRRGKRGTISEHLLPAMALTLALMLEVRKRKTHPTPAHSTLRTSSTFSHPFSFTDHGSRDQADESSIGIVIDRRPERSFEGRSREA